MHVDGEIEVTKLAMLVHDKLFNYFYSSYRSDITKLLGCTSLIKVHVDQLSALVCNMLKSYCTNYDMSRLLGCTSMTHVDLEQLPAFMYNTLKSYFYADQLHALD